jgi:hypothetical protein
MFEPAFESAGHNWFPLTLTQVINDWD